MSVFVQQKTQNKIFFFSVCYILCRRTVSIQQKSSSSSSLKMHSIISNTAHTRTREWTTRSRITLSLSEKSPRGFHEWIFLAQRWCKNIYNSNRDKSRLKNCPTRHKVILEWNHNSIRPSQSYHTNTHLEDELYLKHCFRIE